ncbi:LLM class flavin-dependent oxidoreductase [Hydrogenophaga sp. BPS33]|uniref:LLM class flavin-dependent oxidoreductase n=1 Tax=Hydrogenophaga sp. BPS33 TaxID=2651974 RepID=UPI0013200E64|nr:LLM class flavin-dependent oxidoreductase [Hydrogenophaga sp. BPS33]QHE83514.1 LLM class flavin-dependent oxidoreductase [Hydrogenophaga sp. BPS33]
MTNKRREGMLKLGALIHPTGNHVASWLHPESQVDAGTNFQHYVQVAQIAERGKLDCIFFADAVAVRDGNLDVLSRWPQYMVFFEPTTLIAGLAAMTKNIGFIATATTSYNEPYNVARRFASLDHISGGRAGWNLVTSANLSEAYNFGRDEHYEHGFRYERAKEFADVVRGLWDSWDDDAFLRDRATARYFDPQKVHTLNHVGEHFKVRGPLNLARPPQGHPVIAQAGSSEAGKELAAETAELVFTSAPTLEKSREFYQDVKGRMPRYGRHPDALKILPGLNPIVGRTEAEAREKHDYLQSLIQPEVGLEMLKAVVGSFDLSQCDLDKPLPEGIPETNSSKSSLQHLYRMSKEDGLTLRQLVQRYAGARGQRTIVGTPEQIADDMERWFQSEAVDGFLLQPPYLPGGLEDFTTQVIPELLARGLFRREYEGQTLRENLGLQRPASRYAGTGAGTATASTPATAEVAP